MHALKESFNIIKLQLKQNPVQSFSNKGGDGNSRSQKKDMRWLLSLELDTMPKMDKNIQYKVYNVSEGSDFGITGTNI